MIGKRMVGKRTTAATVALTLSGRVNGLLSAAPENVLRNTFKNQMKCGYNLVTYRTRNQRQHRREHRHGHQAA